MINERVGPGRDHWVRWFVALWLAATALFVIGVAVERSQGHREAGGQPGAPTAEPSNHTDDEGDEPAGEEVGHGTDEGGEAGESSDESTDESVFGVDPESTPAVTAVVLVSLLLAWVAWRWTAAWSLLIGAAFCVAALAFDVREIVHQANEGRTTVAVLAAAVALLHATAAASGVGWLANRSR